MSNKTWYSDTRLVEDLFKKLIQTGYLINIGIYAANCVGKERIEKDEELQRIQRVFRSTLLTQENLSMVSGIQDNSSRKRPCSSSNTGPRKAKKIHTKRLSGKIIAKKTTHQKRKLDSNIRKGCAHTRLRK